LELDEQHEQPGPCERVDFGAWLARSFVAIAVRVVPSILAKAGARSSTRGAVAAQDGQAQGWSKSAIAAKLVKGPHSAQL
jgi:hypothetical protein